MLALFSSISLTIFSFVCGAILGRFGRKTLLVWGCFMCCLLLIVVGVGTTM